MSQTSRNDRPKIRIRGLAKSFGANRVLRGLDLDVADGSSVVVIGGSGTGKSVLLKCILGLMAPDAGSIQIDGEEVVGANGKKLAALRAKIGMLFQGAALFDSLPVWENVAFGLMASQQIGRPEAKAQAVENLKKVGLGASVADLYPAELSGGMKKRVGLARAICTSPEIIFFDEPTTGLDPIMSDVINDLIRTCDMGSVRKIADRVAMLHDGKIIWEGPVESIDTSGDPHVDQFINGKAEGPIKVGA
jgi:phospholipid/cholesterol/gamma-HCH transport system ATP-binding protein